MSKFKTLMICSSVVLTTSAQALTLNFSDLRNGKGFLAISIFSKAQQKAFPGDADKATKTFYISLEDRTELSFTVEDLPVDTYAVAVMHDEDGDKKFKTNFIGMPQEGFGFSRNPRVMFGAPAFSRAEFDSSKTKALDIKLKYF